MRHLILILTLALSLSLSAAESESTVQVGSDTPAPPSLRQWTFAMRTNLLHDALLTPDIGLEAGRGRLALVADGSFARWGGMRRCWHIKRGEIEARYRFRDHPSRQALTGQTIGVFVSVFDYNIKFGNVGRQSEHVSWTTGISYSYSLPLNRHLNLEIGGGIGLMRTKYTRYSLKDGIRVYDGNRSRIFFGPVKAEVSLVWLLPL